MKEREGIDENDEQSVLGELRHSDLAARDVTASQDERESPGEVVLAGYMTVIMSFPDGDVNEELLQSITHTTSPEDILAEAAVSDDLTPEEQARRVATALLGVYNRGLPKHLQLSYDVLL
jgi:hypothetical protein